MTRPIQILLLDTGKEWGGGTNSMLELLKRIDRSRFHITCLFYNDYPKGQSSSLSQELGKIGVELKVVPQRKQPAWAKWAKELARGVFAWNRALRNRLVAKIEHCWRVLPNARCIVEELQRGGYDLLYMNNQPKSNLEGYLAAEMVGVPVVQHCRIEPLMDAATSALVSRRARRVIGVSNGVVETLIAAGVAQEKCVAVLNGIDPEQPLPDGQAVRERLGLQPHEIVFGAVGQLIERKGNRYLLEAAAALIRTGMPLRVLLVGDGPQRQELETLAASLGLQHVVIFAGFQTQPLEFMAAMDVCVLASQSEGLPRVILEAMLLSRPVIATRIVGSKELVVDGETGLLVPYADAAALGSAMRALCSDAALRAQYGRAGYQRVTRHYTIRQYVAGVESVLAEGARR
jgi:glycosyltransferase involved in cell wall biosynthesis